MSSSNLNSPWYLLGAAVVGLVTAAGMLIAEHIKQERRRQGMAQDLERLDRQILGLKGQLEQLQKQQSTLNNKGKPKRTKRMSSGVSTTTTEDYNSALDSSDLEFYDISDDEEEHSKASTITPLDNVLKVVDEKLDRGTKEDVNSAFYSLQDLCYEYPECPELLWRMGRAYYKLSVLAKDDTTTMLDYVSKGLDVCEQALNLKEECGETHKWFALLLGSRSLYIPLKDRIKESVQFKSHVDTAVRLKPEDATLHHLVGRYNMEIAALKWYERKAAAALYGELPTATYEDAIAELELAESLDSKPWKENKVCLAKCYIGLGDYSRAVGYLIEAEEIKAPNVTSEDVDGEIKKLLEQFGSYR